MNSRKLKEEERKLIQTKTQSNGCKFSLERARELDNPEQVS
jgi:hypothetical protein